MTELHDIEDTLLSGFNHIDALLGSGPDWNFRSAGGNKIYYTFSVTAGNEPGEGGQRAFGSAQQAATRQIMEVYLRGLTGIEFVETLDGNAAEVHFCYQDIQGGDNIMGQCAWQASYTPGPNGEVLNYAPRAWIYLDDVQFRAENMNLGMDSFGRETLLHEIGHMLGLKHPHEGEADNPAQLPSYNDSTTFTLMSYYSMAAPYNEFRPADVAALHWIYGGDGLAGELGVNSRTGGMYLVAGSRIDTLNGGGGNDRLQGEHYGEKINGGAGDDTAVFLGQFSDYTISTIDGKLRVANNSYETDILDSIEILVFKDRTLGIAEVYDSSAPAPTSLAVRLNPAGYAAWGRAIVSGVTERDAKVTVYAGNTVVGTTQADYFGDWSLITSQLSDGTHSLTARATDLAGNVSAPSAVVAIPVDATPPASPTASFSAGPGSNQLSASGTADAGTVVRLLYSQNNGYTDTVVAEQVVGADGRYQLTSLPLLNGSYFATVDSIDKGSNSSVTPAGQWIAIASALNLAGTMGNDLFAGTAGNNSFDGGYGLDSVHYKGARAEYTVHDFAAEDPWTAGGHSSARKVQSARDGFDALYGIDRIHFSDVSIAYDIGLTAGTAYRLYRAAFDRVPDKQGVGFWISKLDQGADVIDVAAGFIASAEFAAMYGPAPTDYNFVARLYQHVLHRAPDGAGFDFWMDMLAGGETREQVLFSFSESGENQVQVVAEIAQGVEFLPYG